MHLPGGNEDQLISIFSEINHNDYVFSTHRNIYHALLHGLDPEEIEHKIRNGRSMSIFSREKNFFTSAIIGGMVAIAVGVSLALKRNGSSQKVWCFVGDGTEDSGHFAEAVRYVEGFNLPCEFIIEDDNYAVESSKLHRWGSDKDFFWPKCVRRYKYKKTWPHLRTGKFADIKIMKQVMKSDTDYYPFPTLKKFDSAEYDFNFVGNFKDAVTYSMEEISKLNSLFIGYSVNPGDAMGTLKNVSSEQKIEMPIAENLMVGLAIGMSFEGFKPVVYFERHDFMLVAADAIINHADKIERLSHGEFSVPIIFKSVVADGGLFYGGPVHSQNFTELFAKSVNFPVLIPKTPSEVVAMYKFAENTNGPVMIVEHKKYIEP